MEGELEAASIVILLLTLLRDVTSGSGRKWNALKWHAYSILHRCNQCCSLQIYWDQGVKQIVS